MNDALQQINLSYVAEEDRLLLKVRTAGEAEFRIWFTRRFSGLLAQVLTDQIEREGGYQMLASRRDTLDQLRGGAFDHSYTPGNGLHYPLGEPGVLAYRVNVSKDNAGVMTLQLLPEQGLGINFTLDKSTLYMLYNLLDQGLGQTDWNLRMPRAGHEAVH